MKLPTLSRRTLLIGLGSFAAGAVLTAAISFFLGDAALMSMAVVCFVILIIVIYLSIRSRGESTISAEQAAAQLSSLHSGDRVTAISSLYLRLPENLSGYDVTTIVAGMHSSDRVEAIRILKTKIRRDLSEEEYSWILSGMHSTDQVEAIAILSAD